MFDLTPDNLVLATTEGTAPPPAPIDGAEGVVGTAGDGNGAPAGNNPPASPFGGPFLVIMLALLLGMIVFSMFGQRREKKKRADMMSSIKKHDKVQTVGGVIGSIVEVKPDLVVLKVDESSNTRITFSRSAIQQVLSAGPDSAARAERDDRP